MHNVCSLEDVMAENKSFVSDAVVTLRGHLGNLNTALAKVEAQKTSLDESVAKATIEILEVFREAQDTVIGNVNGITTENQTNLNGQHVTLELAKLGVEGLTTAALETMVCTDYGNHSVKVSHFRHVFEELKPASWPSEPCTTVLVSFNPAPLKDIISRLVHTNECNAKDCRVAVTGDASNASWPLPPWISTGAARLEQSLTCSCKCQAVPCKC